MTPPLPSVPAVDYDALTLDRTGNGPYRLLRGLQDPLVRRFEAAVRDPEAAQRAVLARILDQARATAFARDHALDDTRDLEAFRARVPISGYERFEPYILRIASGERRVLTRAPVRQFLETSGTTGAHKWIPVTDAWARGVAGAQTLWVLGLIREHEEMAHGSALTVVSPAVHGHTSGGLPYGSNTGRMHLAQPWWVRIRYPIPYEAFLIQEPEARIYTILRFALQADIRSITTANPTTILLLFRKLEEYREALAEDLRDGTLRAGPALWIPEAQRRVLERRLRKRPPPHSWHPRDLWRIAAVNCWKGGSAGWFVPRVRDWLGPDVPIREVGISASEGFLATSLSGAWEGAVAWPLGEFMEFIDDAGRARCLWEIEHGGVYRVVLSGTHGMYRYDLADLVEVVGRYRNTPVLRFLRRAGNVLNVTGEKVTEDHILRAMAAACEDAGARTVGFTAHVHMGEVPFYEVGVEWDVTMPDDPGRLLDLSKLLDRALLAANIEYETKRESGRLGPASIRPLPVGTYARFRKDATLSGTPDGQFKDPVMAVDEGLWERVLKAARGDPGAC